MRGREDQEESHATDSVTITLESMSMPHHLMVHWEVPPHPFPLVLCVICGGENVCVVRRAHVPSPVAPGALLGPEIDAMAPFVVGNGRRSFGAPENVQQVEGARG